MMVTGMPNLVHPVGRAGALSQLTALRRVSLVALCDGFADADVVAVGAALGGLPALERLSMALECTYNPRMAVFWRGVAGGGAWFPALRALVLGPGRYVHWRLRPDDAEDVSISNQNPPVNHVNSAITHVKDLIHILAYDYMHHSQCTAHQIMYLLMRY